MHIIHPRINARAQREARLARHNATFATPRAPTASSASHLPCPPPHTIHPRIRQPDNTPARTSHKPSSRYTLPAPTTPPTDTPWLGSQLLPAPLEPSLPPHARFYWRCTAGSHHPSVHAITHIRFCTACNHHSSSPSSSSPSSPRTPHTYPCIPACDTASKFGTCLTRRVNAITRSSASECQFLWFQNRIGVLCVSTTRCCGVPCFASVSRPPGESQAETYRRQVHCCTSGQQGSHDFHVTVKACGIKWAGS
jgi:hypothetical protein